jgi:hypothetical protein
VSAANMFYTEIEWLAAQGISTGWPDGTFRPVSPVNRDAMAAFMYRFAGEPPFSAPIQSPFADISAGVWGVAFGIDVTIDMGAQAGIRDLEGDETFADSPPPPQIRASMAQDPAVSYPDRVEGSGFAPGTALVLEINGVPVGDPPTTDAFGMLFYSPPGLDLVSGDVVEVSDGVVTKSLTLVGLTFDTLDYAADTAAGTSDQPDGTEVRVDVGDMSGGESMTTTVSGGAWGVAFGIDVTIDMGAQAGIRDLEGDETFAESPPPIT